MSYLVWEHAEEWDRWARLERGSKFTTKFNHKLTYGEPATSDMTETVVLDISPEYGIELADSVPNTLLYRVVSDHLLRLVRAAGVAHEAFPLQLRNARGRLESAPYHLLNVLEHRACADLARSDYTPNRILRGRMARIRRLVLDEGRIEPPVALFRLAESPSVLLVREDFARVLREASITGVDLQSLEDYGRMWRSQ